MHIVVVGGAGASGSVAVRVLHEYSVVDHITVADFDEASAQKVAASLSSDRVHACFVDAHDESLLRNVIRGADVVLHAAPYPLALSVLNACLDVKAHYADLGGPFGSITEMMVLRHKAQQAGISAIVGIGQAPGITNLLARAAIDRLAFVERIQIQQSCMGNLSGPTLLLSHSSLRTLLDLLMHEDEAFKDNASLSGNETLYFPEPVGKMTVVHAPHSECTTLPQTFHEKGIRSVSFKIALSEKLMQELRLLVHLGLASQEPLSLQGLDVVPREVLIRLLESLSPSVAAPQDYEVLRVIVAGNVGSQSLDIVNQVVCPPYEPWGIGAGTMCSGAPLAVAGYMLATGEIPQPGIFAPEMCIPVDPFFAALAPYGIHLESELNLIRFS